MRIAHLTLLFFSLLCACTPLKTVDIYADYVFENVHIVPMDKNTVLKNKALAVKDGKIISIVDQSQSDHIKTSRRIDGKSRYLMPGLSDMHVHTRWNPESMFNLFLAHGITTVANMRLGDGGGKIDHLKLREQVASGEIVGPRYLVSSDHFQEGVPKSLSEVNQLLNDYQEKEIDFIKVHGDLPEEIYDALVVGAKKRNLRVIGHAQHAMPLAKTLEMDGLEHMEELLYVSRDKPLGEGVATDMLSAYRANVKRLREDGYRKLVVADIARSGIYMDPTLIAYKMVGVWASDKELVLLQDNPNMTFLPKSVRDRWLNPATNPYQEEGFPITKEEVDNNMEVLFKLTKELYDAGVSLLLGTDTFGTLVPGASAHQELALLVESGLSPFEALTCGTTNVAKYLNESHISGKIANGYRADFILLDGNPLLDIANTKSVSGVFTHDHWYNRADLIELLRIAQRGLL